ncbi:protein kinase/lanthionine synthetase C family protein [bacterium]|nr:protein kinase/lanthionine synthetase C family protein [bacterium]
MMQVDYYYNKIKEFCNIKDQIFNTIQNNFGDLEGFTIHRTIQWIHVYNTTSCLPVQGWKIHISATYISAIDILREVIKVVIEEKLDFKVADSLKTLKVMNDAHYPRGYSGKFITIYPTTIDQFVRVIEKLHICTRGFNGPTILSDKQYKDGIVFYRYGAFKGIKINAKDNKCFIYDENDKLIEDQRNAWFSPPSWVSDPFEDIYANNKQGDIYPKQKINLLYAIRHANKGGVYAAEREDGTKIVLKEARKFVSTDNLGFDVSDYLKNEYNILMLLKKEKYVPQVFEFLQTPYSSFIIEEFIDGQILSGYINSTHKSFDSKNDIHNLLLISENLVEAIIDIHNHGIVIRDLSKNNIIVTDDYNIKLIDFDISYNSNDRIYAPTSGTEGYYFKERNSKIAIVADDVYSIGCILFFMFTNRDPLFFKNDNQSVYSQQSNYLRMVGRAKQIPCSIIELILGLINPDLYNKIELKDVKTSIQEIIDSPLDLPKLDVFSQKFNGIELLEDITTYIINEINFSGGRILPVSKNGEKMSPSCVQTGSSGVGQLIINLSQMGLIENSLLSKFVKWSKDNHYYKYKDSESPVNDSSLYFGISGVLWFLLDAANYLQDENLLNEVQDLFVRHIEPSKIYNDIVLGNAGYGMAAIHFYKKTNKHEFLQIAKEMGEMICNNIIRTKNMMAWPLNDEIFWGFAHGHAGICHYLNVLFTITKENKYIVIANEICDTLISNAIVKNNCASWNFGPDNTKNWSHWCNGSSGIGSTLIRMYVTTGNKEYLKYAELAAKDVYNNIWNSSICQCHGVCGDAEFLYDMYCVTKDPIYLNYISNINEYIFSSRVNINGLNLLTDETKMSVSSDWGTGLAGVGTYIVRIINQKKERIFMNDDVLFG